MSKACDPMSAIEIQARMNAQQLNRIESMMLQLQWALAGQWCAQSSAEPMSYVSSPRAPGLNTKLGTANTDPSITSLSKKRRMRAKSVQKQLWLTSRPLEAASNSRNDGAIDSTTYYKSLFASLSVDSYSTQLADLIGSWESVEVCSSDEDEAASEVRSQVDLEAAAANDCSHHVDASVQTEELSAGTCLEPPPHGACSISGGPSSLDSVLVYTKTEMGRICDALVEPLANAIHSLDDVDSLLSCSSSVADAEISLGTLLRDICSKFVPLTVALDAKGKQLNSSGENTLGGCRPPENQVAETKEFNVTNVQSASELSPMPRFSRFILTVTRERLHVELRTSRACAWHVRL